MLLLIAPHSQEYNAEAEAEGKAAESSTAAILESLLTRIEAKRREQQRLVEEESTPLLDYLRKRNEEAASPKKKELPPVSVMLRAFLMNAIAFARCTRNTCHQHAVEERQAPRARARAREGQAEGEECVGRRGRRLVGLARAWQQAASRGSSVRARRTRRRRQRRFPRTRALNWRRPRRLHE